MRNLLDEPAERRRIRPHHNLIHFLQTQRPHNHLMLLRCADRAADQLDFDCSFGCHKTYIFSGVRPRISITAFLSRSCSSALIVAFTTLCGLWLPIDFVSTFGMPQACTTARTGPPAITPVPSCAGFSITIPAPKRPSTWCGIVFSSRWTRRRFFFAASIPLRIAEGTSLALPTPNPTTRAEESPTTTRAEKLMFLPPLTTFVTRLIASTFSFRFSDVGSTRFTVVTAIRTP